MLEGPQIAHVAAMIGDPARANILLSLMDGRALTASELAQAAGVTLPTTSGHLAKLTSAKLIKATKEGRHRYFVLTDHDVSQAIESLMALSQRTGFVRVRTGPKESHLRKARVCYDHLAGEVGVALLNSLKSQSLLKGERELVLTQSGERFFSKLGLNLPTLASSRRPICKGCLDWSERKYHLAGVVGKFVLDDLLAKKLAKKDSGRALLFVGHGLKKFCAQYGVSVDGSQAL
jgi:DNA-binding transcriptional ArsR family regulator